MLMHGHGDRVVRCPACYNRVYRRVSFISAVENSANYFYVVEEMREALSEVFSGYLVNTDVFVNGKNSYPMTNTTLNVFDFTRKLCKALYKDEWLFCDVGIPHDAVVDDDYLKELYVVCVRDY